MAAEIRDWYDTPHYYDIIFDEDTATEATFLEVMHRRHGLGNPHGRPGTVLEPACGSGRLMREMAKRGWTVAGFDRSPAMLDYARRRLEATHPPQPLLWADGMENFQVPNHRTFHLAHCLVSTFKYLESEEQAHTFLQRTAASLKKGGLFVLGLHLTDYRRPSTTHERWVGRRDGIEVVCNTRTWPAHRRQRTEALRTRLRVTTPDGETRQQETHWTFRTYSAAQLRSLLKKIPALELVACHDFHHDPDTTRHFNDHYADLVLVLRKQSEHRPQTGATGRI